MNVFAGKAQTSWTKGDLALVLHFSSKWVEFIQPMGDGGVYNTKRSATGATKGDTGSGGGISGDVGRRDTFRLYMVFVAMYGLECTDILKDYGSATYCVPFAFMTIFQLAGAMGIEIKR